VNRLKLTLITEKFQSVNYYDSFFKSLDGSL